MPYHSQKFTVLLKEKTTKCTDFTLLTKARAASSMFIFSLADVSNHPENAVQKSKEKLFQNIWNR